MLNMDKLLKARKELEERSNRTMGDFPLFKFWRPAPGSNEVRILPPWTTEGEHAGTFWREVFQHWNVGGDKKLPPILCPSRTPGIEEDCPICEFVDELKSRKDDPTALDLLKKVRAKVTYALAVIDMKDQHYTAADVAEAKQARPDAEVPFSAGDIKVQVYTAPSSVFNQILGLIYENDEDITHPETGRNMFITRNGTGLNTKYSVTPKLKTSPIDLGEQTLEDIRIDLGQFGIKKEYKEMLTLLQEGVGGDYSMALPSGAGSVVALQSPEEDDVDPVGDEEDTSGEDLAARLRGAVNG